MDNNHFFRKFAAGIFFILTIALITGAVFVIGLDKGLTEPRFGMTVLFRKVGGLMVGAPVRVSGVTVGTVSDIDFLMDEVEDRGVKVTLSLYKRYAQQLHKCERIAIITEGVLGEKILEITTQSHYYRPDLSVPVLGADPLDVEDLAQTFGDAAGSLLETSKTINTLTQEIKSISGTTRRLLNRVEQRLIDGDLFKIF
jgi:phospholipid/cholesterol/gamma-HCH transport system substrate-binding protein